MTPEDRIGWLVGVLTVLRDGLAPVVDDLLAGDVTSAELDDLADRFDTVATMLRTVAFDQLETRGIGGHGDGRCPPKERKREHA